MSLKARLEKLEGKHTPAALPPLFITFHDMAVDGWSGGGKEVWRLPGETDQQLEQRAITETGAVLFIQLVKDRPGG